MKKLSVSIMLMFVFLLSFGQGRNISFVKKSIEPYVTSTNDVIKVDDEIMIQEGSTQDGTFRYVQLLNNFNEPIRAAESRFAFKKQKVVFFKIQDGTTYLFTKFFVINIEAALNKNELKIIR